jgi:hypothetical protein
MGAYECRVYKSLARRQGIKFNIISISFNLGGLSISYVLMYAIYEPYEQKHVAEVWELQRYLYVCLVSSLRCRKTIVKEEANLLLY